MCFLKIHTCALSSNVILFGDGAFGILLGLDEVIRVELIPYKKREKLRGACVPRDKGL